MLIGLILLAIALTEFFLGLYFIFRYEKQQSTIWYGLFCIGVSIYVGVNGLGWPGFLINGDQAERWGWVGATLLTSAFLAFSHSFPLPYKKLGELMPLVIWPVIVFIPAFVYTDLFVHDTGSPSLSSGYARVAGQFFWAYILFFAFYWFWSLTTLIRRFLISDGFHRWLLKMLLIGTITSLSVAILFDIVLPMVVTSYFGFVGSLFTSVWLAFTSYILIKKM